MVCDMHVFLQNVASYLLTAILYVCHMCTILIYLYMRFLRVGGRDLEGTRGSVLNGCSTVLVSRVLYFSALPPCHGSGCLAFFVLVAVSEPCHVCVCVCVFILFLLVYVSWLTGVCAFSVVAAVCISSALV